jgi:hypothetical protein
MFFLLVVSASVGIVVYLFVRERMQSSVQGRAPTLEEIPFDGEKALESVKVLCDLGPRPSGSSAMQQQQELLIDHFEKLGAGVRRQPFRARHPRDGTTVDLANLIIEWHPNRTERILLCAHYDTRPFPDRDRKNPSGRFVGANDGASGVAVLMELGRHMVGLEGPVGVDFVLFDGEEFVFSERDRYFLGSEHFAQEYVASPRPFKYSKAVLLDMVGDADLQIYKERNSLTTRESRALVDAVWSTARRLGVREFIPRARHLIRDDHLALRDIARIPACDIIDFDYPAWHTEDDLPAHCSSLSLAKVGWVVLEWLKGSP